MRSGLLALPAVRRVIPLLLLALVASVAAGCGSSSNNTASIPSGSGASSQAAAPTATTGSSSGGCKEVSQPAPRKNGGEKKPTQKLDAKKTYTVTVQTNCGTFAFTLDVKDSPNTTAAFAGLVRKGFFDNLTFHRIVPGFVIQGGDPTGTGQGGPGFSTVDPPPKNAAYTLGVVAMAKTQTEPAGSAGSQFFVVSGQDAQLPPDYALLGKVTKGIDVVQRIGKLGDPADQTGTPTQTVVMQKVTVSP
jgi:peptidyl-prolyl cis-trans isomerase B (cyclophilin B)